MSNILETNSQIQQILKYFSSYLYDMSIMILQVKRLAYTLINVTQPPPKIISVSSDLSSITTACKRTFDDLKRTESILKGHVKGKVGQSAGNSLQGIISEKSSRLKKTVTNIGQTDEDKMNQIKKINKISGQLQSGGDLLNQFNKQQISSPMSKILNTNQQNQIKYYDNSNMSQVHSNSSIHNINSMQDNENVKKRFENIRNSRKKEILQIHNSNIQCIDLIQKIKSELNLKKK